VLSEKAEVYKISKANLLFYFGGSMGVIPESLKGMDTVQQICFATKIEYLEGENDIKRFEYIEGDIEKNKNTVDETEIVNSIKDAWKDLEGLGSKLSDIKAQLLNKPNNNKENILTRMKKEEEGIECNIYIYHLVKDHSKVLGFGTNRIVSKPLNKNGLTNEQLKSMSALQSICGVKKSETEIMEKISSIKKIDGSRNRLMADLDEPEKKEERGEVKEQPKKVKNSLKNLL
jgi:hypothetical protein